MSPEIFLTLGGALKWLGLALSPLLLLPLIVTIWPDPVGRIAKWLSARIDAVSGWALGGAIAGAIILVGAQLLVVLLRYAFGLSFTWLNEIVIYAFAAMFMLGSASALRDDAHVRVDILRPRFGARRRNWIELAGYLHGQQLGESLEDCARRATVYAWSRLESLTPTLPQGDALSKRLERVRVEVT